MCHKTQFFFCFGNRYVVSPIVGKLFAHRMQIRFMRFATVDRFREIPDKRGWKFYLSWAITPSSWVLEQNYLHQVVALDKPFPSIGNTWWFPLKTERNISWYTWYMHEPFFIYSHRVECRILFEWVSDVECESIDSESLTFVAYEKFRINWFNQRIYITMWPTF